MDWIVEIHYKFKLLPETLFITVNIVDRYLCVREVRKRNFQLVGVAAMLIATKYEEIYAPEIKDFVYVADYTYTANDILKCEADILMALDFNVTTPSPLAFLDFFIKFTGADTLNEHVS